MPLTPEAKVSLKLIIRLREAKAKSLEIARQNSAKTKRKKAEQEWQEWWKKEKNKYPDSSEDASGNYFTPRKGVHQGEPATYYLHSSGEYPLYVYLNKEIAEKFGTNRYACNEALNFLAKFNRLVKKQPTIEQLSEVFKITQKRTETGIIVSDPQSFPPEGGGAFAISYEQIDAELTTNDEQLEDIEQKIERIMNYLAEYYKKHGKIGNSFNSHIVKDEDGQFSHYDLDLQKVLEWEKAQPAD